MECMNFIQDFIQHRRTETSLHPRSALPCQPNVQSVASSMPVESESVMASPAATDTEINNGMESLPFFEESVASDVVSVISHKTSTTTSDLLDSHADPLITQGTDMTTTPSTGTSTNRRRAHRIRGPNVEDAFERVLKVPRTEDEALGDLVASQLRCMKKCHWMTVSAEIIAKMADLHQLYGKEN